MTTADEKLEPLTAPFPWFGGKRRVASLVWERFGNVPNYLEPFAGSLAVMLGRPHRAKIETVNDLDCCVANFWRAVQRDPEAVAHHADNPVNEADLHARHRWLVAELSAGMFSEKMKHDPDFFDAKIAGWWAWGLSCWIGNNWCSESTWNSRPSLGTNGTGVVKIRAKDVSEKIPNIDSRGQKGICSIRANDIERKWPDLHRGGGRGCVSECRRSSLVDVMLALADRLKNVRVCCGDWSRILGDSPTIHCGSVSGVFLDPPYAVEDRDRCYAHDSFTLSAEVRAWAITRGDDPRFRIALCGYEEEHGPHMPSTWACVTWKATGGYGNQRKSGTNHNARRERIWFSPHCLDPLRLGGGLFAGIDQKNV